MQLDKDLPFRFTSLPQSFISNRFVVKTSVMELANKKISVSVAVFDVLEHNFRLTYFSSDDAATQYIELLREAK